MPVKQINLLPRPQIEAALHGASEDLERYMQQQEQFKSTPPSERPASGFGNPSDRIKGLNDSLLKSADQERRLSDAIDEGFQIIAQYPYGRDGYGVTLILYKSDKVGNEHTQTPKED